MEYGAHPPDGKIKNVFHLKIIAISLYYLYYSSLSSIFNLTEMFYFASK